MSFKSGSNTILMGFEDSYLKSTFIAEIRSVWKPQSNAEEYIKGSFSFQ